MAIDRGHLLVLCHGPICDVLTAASLENKKMCMQQIMAEISNTFFLQDQEVHATLNTRRFLIQKELAEIWISVNTDDGLLRKACNELIVNLKPSVDLQLWSEDILACHDEVVGQMRWCDVDKAVKAFHTFCDGTRQ